MNKVATFFTIYWCIYFPTCIAYNELPGFSSIDEAMTGILIVYTIMMRKKPYVNQGPLQETWQCIGVFTFFTIYGLLFSRNVAGGVWLDFIQEIRPYSVVYCTWILNPQFSEKQKKCMLGVMIATLFSWIYYHPESTAFLQTGVRDEFPVLGQLAICTGMTWYLLTEPTRKNAYIALALAASGMIAPKFKYMGEVACFIAAIFFLKEHLSFKKAKTIAVAFGLIAVVLFVTWAKVDAYYVSGMENENLARPMTYKVAFRILYDYFPFGSGMGSFACNGAWKFYSPIYHEYHLDRVYGLDHGGGFICDSYYPTLAQFGVVGLFFFLVFWERKVRLVNSIKDMRYYRVAWITFFCLAIEQTADSSWLSGKGMGYCMLLGLCFNGDLNTEKEDDEEDENEDEDDDENNDIDDIEDDDDDDEWDDDRDLELNAPRKGGLITPGHKFNIRTWRDDHDDA